MGQPMMEQKFSLVGKTYLKDGITKAGFLQNSEERKDSFDKE